MEGNKMRFLTLSDFSRYSNKLDMMASIAEFKIPKGMVYAFSTRMNMSIFVQEENLFVGDGSTVAFTLTSDAIQCADLGAAATPGEDMKNQIVVYNDGAVDTDWDIAWATMIITFDTAPLNTKEVNVFYCSKLNAAVGARSKILEVRAEAPAGQNLGIPIFSGSLDEIMGNEQNSDLAPLRLDSAVLLPEGFVLAAKVNASAACLDGTELIKTGSSVFSDGAYAAERLRIPYDRLPLTRFAKTPQEVRNFKARILASMATS
ncbi:hypothetical protein LCGC14_1752820 [marine sediment metagenome]|uniref:Uncharacterized protein n=1 Tax=marine sediment metagenome TaxID=412755 RepID=A0A0F9H3H7_9ZZZZ